MTKQPPVTLRVPADMRTDIEAFAAKKGIAKNAAYVEVLGLGLMRAAGEAGSIPEREAPGPARVAPMAKLDRLREIVRAKPAGRFMGTTALGEELPPPKPFNPQPKKGKK